jgi:putative ABC transport system permease protein
MYQQELKTGDMAVVCAVLAVFIACLGLVGLASYTSEQRTREVGIRKAIGASERGILVLMTQEFVILVAIAKAIALPVSYYVMRDWLSAFAYRIELGATIFAFAFGLSMVIALATVSYHAVRAMRLDPVTALRQE